MSIMSSQLERSASQNGRPDVSWSVTMNALFTSTSSRPCSASTRSNSASTAASSRWSSATAMPLPPASTAEGVDLLRGGADRARQRVVGLAGGAGGHVDGRAGGAELERDALADAAARAGDDRDLAVPAPAHASPNQTSVRCATVSWNPSASSVPRDQGADDGHAPDRPGRRGTPVAANDVHASRMRARQRVGVGRARSPVAPANSRHVLTSKVPNVNGRSSAWHARRSGASHVNR